MKTKLLLVVLAMSLLCCKKEQTDEITKASVTPSTTPTYTNHGVYCLFIKKFNDTKWYWPTDGCKTDSMVAVILGDKKINDHITPKYIIINQDSCEDCLKYINRLPL